ncbi:MAG: transglutaminase-like domain-containing protein [Acidobacteriota bacterium]|nr:transglutaminase-like domain-containing protein [Acidobacteriota bacterium]
MTGRARASGLLLSLLLTCEPAAAGEQTGTYRASGGEARLFDQYDNDGYSMAVTAGADGSSELTVRVSDAPLESAAPYPTGAFPDGSLPPAPDRDAFARRLAMGSRTAAEAVRRVLVGVATEVRYDTDRLRNQDPGAVFASRRAYCVGFAELAVDLLRRIGISARTVQGVLRTEPDADRYESEVGGVYHRWIEVWYPDRGYVFSDPRASINGVDARYVPFTSRSLRRPKSLRLTELVPASGDLAYGSLRAGETVVRLRAVAVR